MSTLDTDIFLDRAEPGEGLAATAASGASNAVVNTQNNTESFQAGKSALAVMNINTAKSLYATLQAEHPEWDVQRV